MINKIIELMDLKSKSINLYGGSDTFDRENARAAIEQKPVEYLEKLYVELGNKKIISIYFDWNYGKAR